MKFEHDPIRYRLHLECIFDHEFPASELTMEGVFKTEIITEGDVSSYRYAHDITDVGSIVNYYIPKGCLNPPHLYFQIGRTKYRFWGQKLTLDGHIFDFKTIKIMDFEREKLGVPPDWQPPVKLEED